MRGCGVATGTGQRTTGVVDRDFGPSGRQQQRVRPAQARPAPVTTATRSSNLSSVITIPE
ncbi:short-chain type dehydrogenase/reductase domain protein [Mycobacterium ulcerans str. Harvey]|uniref:Short-chain type dehydrogenase/reductase domain protein n=1 Tax=Mycobacterium ulcerans str. Harvey TaxID=1299332 RepID=A0ABP3A226_MYCUL|nr:short-chain type dehydrogenase/reductase domain protein [Mycobacterium ulcerans str. Harvey]